MTQFLQSNVSLVVGAVLMVVILGAGALLRDRDLRHDLRGAFWLLFAFLVLRLSAFIFDGQLTGTAANVVRMCWMLTFAFGTIRFTVSMVLWGLRFTRRTPTPKILRDVINVTLYAIVSVPIIKSTLKIDVAGLVATSAILSVVIGLAMQDTLGNLFAGLSLQLERPFEVGDVVKIGTHTGTIAQIGWRATRIETFRHESITLPNNIIAKEAVTNFSRGEQPIATDVYIAVAYSAPPNRVKAAILETLAEFPEVLPHPPPHCRAWAYKESGIDYQVRFFVKNFDTTISVMEQLHTRVWYRFERDGINVAFPQRIVTVRNEAVAPLRQSSDEILGLLSSVDLLALLKPSDLRTLADEVVPRRFAAGERVITEGDAGNTFYVIASGSVSVRAGPQEREIAKLGHGQYFGEMSLLTDEPRSASVLAATDALLYEITRPTFARFLAAHPELGSALAELLARRRTELRAVANQPGAAVESAPEARRIFSRLRELFGLDDA